MIISVSLPNVRAMTAICRQSIVDSGATHDGMIAVCRIDDQTDQKSISAACDQHGYFAIGLSLYKTAIIMAIRPIRKLVVEQQERRRRLWFWQNWVHCCDACNRRCVKSLWKGLLAGVNIDRGFVDIARACFGW